MIGDSEIKKASIYLLPVIRAKASPLQLHFTEVYFNTKPDVIFGKDRPGKKPLDYPIEQNALCRKIPFSLS